MPKTMTLRLDDVQAATLEMVARADDHSLTDAVRQAIDDHIAQRRADKGFQDRLTKIVEENREVIDRLAK